MKSENLYDYLMSFDTIEKRKIPRRALNREIVISDSIASDLSNASCLAESMSESSGFLSEEAKCVLKLLSEAIDEVLTSSAERVNVGLLFESWRVIDRYSAFFSNKREWNGLKVHMDRAISERGED